MARWKLDRNKGGWTYSDHPKRSLKKRTPETPGSDSGNPSKAHSLLVLFILHIKVENHTKLEQTLRNVESGFKTTCQCGGRSCAARRNTKKTNVSPGISAQHLARAQCGVNKVGMKGQPRS